MTTLIVTCIAIMFSILTLWYVVIPAGVVVGTFNALRHGEWKGWWKSFTHS